MKDESDSPHPSPRPLAWVALGVSTFVTGLVWLSTTEQGSPLFYALFAHDFMRIILFFGLTTIATAILDIVAGWRGRANRIIALIALLIVLSPLAISLTPLVLP
jgi:hypothetical protein